MQGLLQSSIKIIITMIITCLSFSPQEGICVVYGLLYFILVPCMYMLLMIYALINLNNVSWGVRETAASETDQAIEQAEEQRAQIQLQEKVAEATGLRRLVGMEAGWPGKETGWTLLVSMWYRSIVKARTHRPILSGLAAESAVESADSAADSSKIGV